MRRRIAVVAFLIALLAAPVVGHVVLSLLPGFGSFVVAGTSMEPTIGRGSIIYVHATGQYEPADAITFVVDDRVVTHRVVAESSHGLVTKGDANDASDDWHVDDSQVVGEVFLVVPLVGYLIGFVGRPAGYVAVVLLPGLVLLGLEVRHLIGLEPGRRR